MHWLLKTPQGAVVVIILLVVMALLLYFFPSILAFARDVVHLRRIFLAPRRFEWVVWYHDGPVMAVRWG